MTDAPDAVPADSPLLHAVLRARLLSVGGLALLLAAGAGPAAAQAGPDADEAPFARFPDVSPDGSTVAFSYQGDVFTVPTEGGTARRLTIHEGYDAHPRWSEDGSRLAFVSDRFGNDDVFVMAADGSGLRRLTHHSASDALGDWTPDGRLLFETERTYVQVERESEIYHVAAEGGTPDRLLDVVGYAPRASADGRFVAFTFGSNGRQRKGYRGPADKDVWIHDTSTGETLQLTDFDGNDMLPAWAGGRTLYFVSERDGAYDLYRIQIGDDGEAASEPEQLTDFEEDGVRAFGVSADGGTVVLERRTRLYVLRPGQGAPTPLALRIPDDDRFDRAERRTYTEDAEEYAVSPDGDLVAFVARGEVFVTANDPEESRTRRLTRGAWRDRDVAWTSDSTLVFASDRDGDYDLYGLASADPDEPDLLLSLEHEISRLTDTDTVERSPVVSPEGGRLAFVRGRGTLVVAELTAGGIGSETILLDGWAEPSGLAWSPDGRWLAYSLEDLDFNAEVYVHRADGSAEPVNVSQHPKGDGAPVWSEDGSKLGFLSQRNAGDADVWFAWLREEDWQKTQEDWSLETYRQEQQEEEEEDDEEEEDEGPEPVEIDLEGIHERLEQVTSLPGNESDLAISEDGETLFFVDDRPGRTSPGAEQDLHSVKWDGSELEALTTGGQAPYSVQLGPDGERLYLLRSGGRIARIGTEGDEMESIPFSGRMVVDHAEEARQIFDEAWRLLERNFYDPAFHGVDWRAMRDKYRPWALEASTKRDFRDVFNMMLGELNASHLGLYGPDRAETQDQETGLPGVEIDPVQEGVRVERVVPDGPADREASRLYEGDVITAVDGEPVRPDRNFYALLTDRVDERVVLTVRGTDGASREVVIRPAGSLYWQLYREWVEDRKELTERYSDGRLGYIHVQGMNWPSFERFERELVASGQGKEGLLVDVRFNGGGWTTDYLMAVLTVRQHAYTVPRGATADLDASYTQFREHYPFGPRLPLAAWTKPVAALCNANSFSNAEIFSHAFKTLDLGPLVGEPTYGAVISTGGAGLIDGSFVRLPFRGWYVKATDRNMENGPAVPDVTVPRRPDDRADGEDEQLRRAVEVLLEDIDGGDAGG